MLSGHARCGELHRATREAKGYGSRGERWSSSLAVARIITQEASDVATGRMQFSPKKSSTLMVLSLISILEYIIIII